MKRSLLAAVVINVSLCLTLSQGADKKLPHARVCVGVIDSTTGEEEAFQAGSHPGKGKQIVAHLDATGKCEAVIAALDRRTGQLANGWLPQFVQIAPQREVVLPRAPMAWNWTKESGPIDFHVLVFSPGSSEGAELKTLVGAMQKTQSEAMTRQQANKLRELIGRVKIDQTRAGNTPKVESTEVAGVFRMTVGFEWRDSARTVNFTADKPGAVIFSR